MPRRAKIFPTEVHNGVAILTPEGDALGVQESHLRQEIDQLHVIVDQPAVRALVVDLGRAKYFSSIVIGAVITVCTKLRERGKPALMCNAAEPVLDVLQIMKLDTVMPYFRTRDEALGSLQTPAA